MPTTSNLLDEDRSVLQKALEGALPMAKRARTASFDLLFQMLLLRDDPESAPLEIRELLRVIQATAALSIFDHARQHGLGHEERVDLHSLVHWLISRAQQVGSLQAITDLGRYIGAEHIDVTEVLAVDGVDIDAEVTFGEYSLLPWQSVPMTDTKWQVAARTIFTGDMPTAAVTRRHKVRRIHLHPWDQPPAYAAPLSIEPMIDILRCLTASAGIGFRLLHHWHEPDDWAPWSVSLSNFGRDSTTRSLHKDIGSSESKQAASIVQRLQSADDMVRSRLRVQLDRLNRSYLTWLCSVDSAIELGIALESLFAPTKLTEGISFAVRVRAARLLGGSMETRRANVKILQEVYDLRSRAVHSGRFDAGDAPKKWRDEQNVRAALQAGQALVGASLVKVIESGEPNWEEFDIGS